MDIIDFGFPRPIYDRKNRFNNMDKLSCYKRFRLRKETTVHVLEQIEHNLEYDNDL